VPSEDFEILGHRKPDIPVSDAKKETAAIIHPGFELHPFDPESLQQINLKVMESSPPQLAGEGSFAPSINSAGQKVIFAPN
jgi:hypothetical protein